MSENAVVSFDQPAEFWAIKADRAAKRGDYLAALDLWHTAMRKDSSQFSYVRGAVKALEKLGAYEAAACQIRKSINLFPVSDYGEMVYELGCAYQKLGDKKRAVDALYAYLSGKPEPAKAQSAKEMLLDLDERFTGETESNKRANTLMRQSGASFFRGDNARMNERLSRALISVHGKRRAEILSMLAMCHLGGDRHDEAAACALAALRLKRGDVRASCVLACVYASRGRFSLSALVMRIAAEGELRSGGEAENSLYRRFKPDEETLFCETCASLSLSEIVRLLYAKKLEDNPYSLTALYRLGAAQLNLEMYGDAESSFYRYLRLLPSDGLVSRLRSLAQKREPVAVTFTRTLPSELIAREVLPPVLQALRGAETPSPFLSDAALAEDARILIRDTKFSVSLLSMIEGIGAEAEKKLLLPLLADEEVPMSVKYSVMLRLYTSGVKPPFLCVSKTAVSLTQMTKRMSAPAASPFEAQTFRILLSMLPAKGGRGSLALREIMTVLRPTIRRHPPLSGATPQMYAEALMCRRNSKHVPRVTPNALLDLISDDMDEVCGRVNDKDTFWL
ncbi:MAG: hypothetical protein PHI27_09705 [Eubacteriales bacterium]|nr:hypothetical protein [Eubacteriales bacterium]MDD3882517.1 hypothetical protein [Eubacteriales bacterium]MDD4512817.1 hypothetical protein [Eubacteriales bacterium]